MLLVFMLMFLMFMLRLRFTFNVIYTTVVYRYVLGWVLLVFVMMFALLSTVSYHTAVGFSYVVGNVGGASFCVLVMPGAAVVEPSPRIA